MNPLVEPETNRLAKPRKRVLLSGLVIQERTIL